MYQSVAKNKSINNSYPGFNLFGSKLKSELSVGFQPHRNLMVIKGKLSGKGYERILSKALYDLEFQQKRISSLNVYINVSEIDNSGLIGLFKITEQLNTLSKLGKNITVYWNTNNDPNVFGIAREFEKVLKGQLFYADI